MKKRSPGKVTRKDGRGRKRNRDPKIIQSSLASAGGLNVVQEVQKHGDAQPLENGSESPEDTVASVSEMVLQHVEHMQAMARGIVQSVQMLVTHAQLEFASFGPPTYLLSDIDNDLQQLIYVQEQGDAQPSGDGAESSDLSTAVEDGDAQRSQKDHVKRLWDFLQQFQVHLEAFIRWIRRWLMVIATHLNLDLSKIAPSADEFLSDMENVF